LLFVLRLDQVDGLKNESIAACARDLTLSQESVTKCGWKQVPAQIENRPAAYAISRF